MSPRFREAVGFFAAGASLRLARNASIRPTFLGGLVGLANLTGLPASGFDQFGDGSAYHFQEAQGLRPSANREAGRPGNVVNLFQALKKSLQEDKAARS